MTKLPVSLFALAFIALGGCASLKPQDFAAGRPLLDPQHFFEGRTVSFGVFETPAGEPQRRFTSVAVGRREGDVLLLDQKFTYDNGEIQQRHWRIRRVNAHDYEATANDVVGTAHGQAYGNAFLFEYTVALHPGNPIENVGLRQWFYLEPGGQKMINRAVISKLGLRLATVTEYFSKE